MKIPINSIGAGFGKAAFFLIWYAIAHYIVGASDEMAIIIALLGVIANRS